MSRTLIERSAAAVDPRPPPRSRWQRVASVLVMVAPALGVLGFLGAWQLFVVVFDVRKFILPTPWDILGEIKADPGFYVRNARTTLWEAFLGFLIAAVVGTTVAAAMAHSRFIERAVMPLAVLIQVTPIIAYAPVVAIWLDIGQRTILTITSLVCFVPFLINGVAGLRSVDTNLLELAHSVDARRREIFFRLRLPSALPYLFAAARIAVGLALIGAVIGEFFGSRRGLGNAIAFAQGRTLSLQLWACVYVLALIGGVATLLLVALERRVLHWHSSQRS